MPQSVNKEQKKLLIKLGNRLKAIRQAKGYTLEQVGFKVGKDRQSIHKLEKGDFNPTYIYLLDVCKGLDIKLKDVVEDD